MTPLEQALRRLIESAKGTELDEEARAVEDALESCKIGIFDPLA